MGPGEKKNALCWFEIGVKKCQNSAQLNMFFGGPNWHEFEKT